MSAGSRSCSFIERRRSSICALLCQRDLGGRLEIDDRHRAAAEQRSLMVRRQEASSPARCAALGRSFGLRHHHEGRQVVALRAQTISDPAPQAGKAHQDPAGIHLVHRRSMDHAVGIARAQERDVVGVRDAGAARGRTYPCPTGHTCPICDGCPGRAGSFSRNWLWILPKLGGQGLAVEAVQERLGVEEIHLARPAGHEQENAALGLGGKMAGLGRQGISRRTGPGFTPHEVGQAEQAKSAAGGLEKLASTARQEGLGARATADSIMRNISQFPSAECFQLSVASCPLLGGPVIQHWPIARAKRTTDHGQRTKDKSAKPVKLRKKLAQIESKTGEHVSSIQLLGGSRISTSPSGV